MFDIHHLTSIHPYNKIFEISIFQMLFRYSYKYYQSLSHIYIETYMQIFQQEQCQNIPRQECVSVPRQVGLTTQGDISMQEYVKCEGRV